MNLITSYKTELELLKKFIEEEEERKCAGCGGSLL